MKPINVIMMISPVAKGRPRAAIVKGRIREYTPAETRNSEAEIRISIRDNVLHTVQFDPKKGPYFGKGVALRLEAIFVLPRPPSIPKKRRFPVTRPDADNYMKLLQDALNKFLYVDDGQLTTVVIKKRYGLMPAIHLSLSEDCEGEDSLNPRPEANGNISRRMGSDKRPCLPGMQSGDF